MILKTRCSFLKIICRLLCLKAYVIVQKELFICTKITSTHFPMFPKQNGPHFARKMAPMLLSLFEQDGLHFARKMRPVLLCHGL